MTNCVGIIDASPRLDGHESLNGLFASASSPTASTTSSATEVSLSPTPGTVVVVKKRGRKKVIMDEEERRKRNRENMQRVRQRKCKRISDMRACVAQLEAQLAALQVGPSAHAMITGVDVCKAVVHSPQLKTYRQLNRSYSEVTKLCGELREERYWLKEELKKRQQSMQAVRSLVEEMNLSPMDGTSDSWRQYCLNQAAAEEEGAFRWLYRALAYIWKPVAQEEVFELVRQSYEETMAYARLSASYGASPNTVLGWGDKRRVDDTWAEYMFEKEFTHETMEQLMERTWQVSTDIKHVRKLQPSFRQMKLLQRLNDDTMVFARNFSFPHDDTNFCSIFLLFRLETETGYIIGTRTLRPLCSNDVLERVLGKKVSFVHLFYSFLFDRLPSSSTNQSDGEQSGCVVRFGGRVGNGTKMYAHTCALDVLLVCLRWESYCVRPLYRLSAGVEACNEEPEFKGDDTKRYHISDVPSISKGETENQPILSII